MGPVVFVLRPAPVRERELSTNVLRASLGSVWEVGATWPLAGSPDAIWPGR